MGLTSGSRIKAPSDMELRISATSGVAVYSPMRSGGPA
jgi:hypothetical protein